MDEFCGSEFWNSSEAWYLNRPIFTKCFKEIILNWLPCLVYWLLLPFEIYYLRSSCDRNIPWTKINVSKLIMNGLLIALCASDFVTAFALSLEPYIYPVDICTAFLRFATFLMVFVIVVLNRYYGVHTSGCQFLFWLCMVISSICRILSSGDGVEKDLFWSKYKYASFVTYFSLLVVSLILNCYADAMPRNLKYPQTNDHILPERLAGFLSRITYCWFDKTAWKGYRNPLNERDLWQLRPQETTKEVIKQFHCHWPNSNETVRVQVSILIPIIKSFAGVFLFGSFMKLLTDLLTFVHPQILRWIIAFVEYKNTDRSEPQWLGISYAILLFITASIQTIVLCQYFHRMFIVGLRLRSALIGEIYRKALLISNAARMDFSTGEIVNLMAFDAQRLMDLTTYVNMIWSAPLQITLALYFLWQQLGPSVLAGLAAMVILIPVNAAIARRNKTLQFRQMQYKDQRVKLMNEILNGIKIIKLNAWEECFEDHVLRIREKEIATLKATAFLNATTFLLMFCASFLVSLVTFGAYVLIDENHVLDATKTFVSLSLFNALSFPLSTLPTLITNMVQAQISVKRINKFLNSSELDTKVVQHEPNDVNAIAIEHGCFSWTDDLKKGDDDDDDNDEANTQMQLVDISIQIRKESLCSIVGSVGSGKSSLIQAILGEMSRSSGKVNVDGSIAYVPQQSWILNSTVRENILFGREYDRKHYDRILAACALHEDVERFPCGDLTEIGERGINLSGGQRQRISLARAIYSDANIYLLDDPLSAVDTHVGSHIFEHVIGPGGLLEKKTRVLVTHSLTFLPQVDYIYVLKAGKIYEHGSYSTLLGKKCDYFRVHQKSGIEMEMEIEIEKTQINETTEMISHTMDAGKCGRESVIWSKPEKSELCTEKHDGKLIEVEQMELGKVRFDIYKYYIKSVGVTLTMLTLLLSLAFQALQIASNLWLTKWSNEEDLDNGSSKRNTSMYLGVYAAFGFMQGITSFLAMLTLSIGCLYCSRDLHMQLLWNVLRWPMALFDTTPVGRLINRFSKDIDTIDNALPQNFRMILMQALALAATIVVICISSPVFLIASVPITILYIFVQRIYVATSRQLIRLESISRSPIYSHFGETLAGVTSIRAYGINQRFIEISDNRVDRNHCVQYPALIANRWLSVRLETIGNFIIFFAAILAVLSDQANPGLVGLSISYALQITDTLKWLVRLWSDIENNIVAVERIKEYSEFERQEDINRERKPLRSDWPSEGKIVFENFQVRYREDLDLLLRGVSFSVGSCQKVGIVGRTGAGKSSLMLSIFRLIESAGGRILIDDIDIADLSLQDLRSRLTIVPQEPVLFSGTLRSNIDPFELKADDEILRAIELSHLNDFVNSLPAGLSHTISEGGANLSVGQCQLICLARAILKKSKIFVLDEATAAIDPATDELIQKTIREEFRDCTVLTIAHRLKTILDYDQIIVLDRGSLVEMGSPTELLNKPDSLFYAMAKEANVLHS